MKKIKTLEDYKAEDKKMLKLLKKKFSVKGCTCKLGEPYNSLCCKIHGIV